MTIKTDLQVFYNQEAKKYYETRKKFWQEGSLILQTLKTLADTGKKLSILEIGCGSGRFANYLQQHYAGKFSYVGVDLSEKLLAYAKQDTPKLKFICEDMGEFIVRQKQESFDVIIGVASFQHIPSSRERLFLMKHFYRALRYDGLLIMTNRSLSHWFLQKH
jgi:SAM-dependent methyltransferase